MPGVRFPSTEALRRLGISDPEVFYPKGGELTPTIQVADLSRTISTEPVEGRGYFWDALPAPLAGVFARMELHCRAPGGLVVERLQMLTDDGEANVFAAAGALFSIDGSGLFTAGLAIGESIGGVQVRSRAVIDGTVVVPSGPRWFNAMSPTTIFLAPTQVLSITQRTAAQALSVGLIWRELAEIQG